MFNGPIKHIDRNHTGSHLALPTRDKRARSLPSNELLNSLFAGKSLHATESVPEFSLEQFSDWTARQIVKDQQVRHPLRLTQPSIYPIQ
jgi:hypothetical protein